MYGPAVLVRKDTGHGVGGKIAKDKKRVFEPRIELGTFCVLSRRDNQLHHPNTCYQYTGGLSPKKGTLMKETLFFLRWCWYFRTSQHNLQVLCSCNSVGRVLVL